MTRSESLTGSNIWFTSIYLLVPAVLTFVFWFVAARIGGPEALGIASVLASISFILSTIDVLDMSSGMKRYLGKAIFARDLGTFKQILVSTCVIASIMIFTTSIFVLLPEFGLMEMLGLDRHYTYLLILMVVVQSFQIIFAEALISSLQSKKLVAPQIVGNLTRFPLIIIIVYYLHANNLGTIFGYIIAFIISASIYGIYLALMLSKNRDSAFKGFIQHTSNSLRAGISSWVPNLLNILGLQLGVLTVFTTTGALEAGRMYLILGVYFVGLFIVKSICLVTHPIIGNVKDRVSREAYLMTSIRIAFSLSVPVVCIIIFYGNDLLSIIGKEYVPAAGPLSILMLSVPLACISEVMYYYFYGLGNHKNVLYLGLMGNVPRMTLYIIISGPLGALGAAIAYTIGSVVQVIYSISIAKKERFPLEWKNYIAIFTICVIPVGICSAFGIPWYITIVVLLAFCIYFYIKMGIFSQSIIRQILYSIFPTDRADRIYKLVVKVIEKIEKK